MLDYYLKFNSEQEAFDAFKEAGYTTTDMEGKEFIIRGNHEFCVDLIGSIFEGGQWEYQDGQIVMTEAPVAIPGYHVNVRMIRGDIADCLRPFIIDKPQTPYRIFG